MEAATVGHAVSFGPVPPQSSCVARARHWYGEKAQNYCPNISKKCCNILKNAKKMLTKPTFLKTVGTF
jgi:hypothetical protein